MQKKVFQLIVYNTAGVLSRISGLFSRRGYNIESITAGATSDPKYTRITIVANGDNDILDQIEKQLGKLVDVINIKELVPSESVYRELVLVKVSVSSEKRQNLISLTDVFRAKVVDITANSMIIELTGAQSKVEAFLSLLEDYEILEIARTGIAGLERGSDNIIEPK